MKPALIILLLIAQVAFAGDSNWQGPRPAVTQTELPEYVKDAIRERLNDPASMEVVSWTLPTLRVIRSGGDSLGRWDMRVNVRASNVYGGLIVGTWSVSIRNGAVLFCDQLR